MTAAARASRGPHGCVVFELIDALTAKGAAHDAKEEKNG